MARTPADSAGTSYFDSGAADGVRRPLLDADFLKATIRRNLWLILSILGVCVALALAAFLLTTPTYTSTATLQVNEAAEEVLGNDEEAADETNIYNYERFVQTQVDVLQSRNLANRVENELDLSEDASFFDAVGIEPALIPADEAQRERIVATLLARNLSINIPRNTRIVPISFTASDAVLATRIVNTYAEQAIQANLQRKYDSTSYAREFVADQLAEAKQRVAESERTLNDYARSNSLINLSSPAASGEEGTGGASVVTASLAQINAAANVARADRIQAQSRWNAIANTPLYSSAPVRSDPTVSALLARQAQVEASLAEERARRLEGHPAVEALRAELVQIESNLREAANNVRRSVRAEYEAAQAVESQLTGQVNALKSETLSEQDASVQYALLAREADTNRQLYEELLQRFKELNASSGITASNISIVDLAEVPAVPTAPSLLRNLAIGIILGLVLAGIVVFLRTELDDSVRVPEDVEGKLGLPLLGVAPEASGGNPLEELHDPKSPLSEAYASLRSNLMFATPEGLPRTMLITSSAAGEGKSTTSRALSHGFARVGKRVLLVDADIRRPTLHKVSGVDNQIGLTTVLTGQAKIADAIQQPDYGSYYQMTSGPIPPAPSEMLASARMQEVVDELAEQFDIVILDSPPMLGLADAPNLSVLVDGVIFAIEAGRSHRGALKASLRRLNAVNPNLLGAILTRFDPQDAANSYSAYYGYDYYQYRQDDDPKLA